MQQRICRRIERRQLRVREAAQFNAAVPGDVEHFVSPDERLFAPVAPIYEQKLGDASLSRTENSAHFTGKRTVRRAHRRASRQFFKQPGHRSRYTPIAYERMLSATKAAVSVRKIVPPSEIRWPPARSAAFASA